MARFHRLQSIGPNSWNAVIHARVPDASNSAGVPWSQAIVSAGLNRSVLSPDRGEISKDELLDIVAGRVLEKSITWGVDAGRDSEFVEDHISKAGADGIAEGAIASEAVFKKERDERGREIDDGTGRAKVTKSSRLIYNRGVDASLDGVVDRARAKSLSDYIDREIVDALAEMVERLDQPMMTVE